MKEAPQKSTPFLYTNNELSEEEIKETIPFTIASKTIKYSGISLTKKVKELDTENFKDINERNWRRHK